MKINNIYTSVACNRTPESADWGNNGLILFASCNAVSVFDPKYNVNSAKITRTYNGHTKRVNTVKWIRNLKNNNETEFISGSDDGKAIIWDINDPDKTKKTICLGHESGVNVVEAIYTKDYLTIATGSADSTVKIWQKTDDNCECLQTILLKNGFCFALRMTIIPTTEQQLLLTYAGDDDSISLWTECNLNNKRQFQPIHQFIGHEDWVRGLDFVTTDENDLLLASSSQDNFIRLWRISLRTTEQVKQNEIDFLNIPDGDIHVEENILKINSIENNSEIFLAVSIESVLQGHEGWVYGINWHKCNNQIQLLSSSIDKTLIIWKLTEDGVWMENVRVGEVGGNSLGFFGGKFSKNGKSILGHGFQGSFHIWNQSVDDDNMWIPNIIIGGHFNEVRDLSWEPYGQFLYTLSADQTTRIHGPWIRPINKKIGEITWHEIARPQVHGYDMQTIAVFSRYKFATGAEEKIIRTFQAPGNFIENFRRISNIENDQEGDELLKTLPKGASVPSLGLSNKAVYNCDENPKEQKHVRDEYPENYFIPINSSQPPQEEALMQNTLWPEIQKLYGHGFEIFALTSSPNGKLLASSCKASSAEHAQIILWNTTTWKQVQKLSSHQLTVTQMKFSPNNKYLISVSRDRKWTLFENKSDNDNFDYQIIARPDKTNGIHSRIIWSCDWSHDSKFFITTSRDGKFVVWGFNNEIDKLEGNSLGNCISIAVNELSGESITACAFAPDYYANKNGEYLIALGLESGKIYLYKLNNKNFSQLHCIERRYSHHMTVRKLQFRPCTNQLFLASCGDDNFVRINEVIM